MVSILTNISDFEGVILNKCQKKVKSLKDLKTTMAFRKTQTVELNFPLSPGKFNFLN